jgi:hypothetical protein
MHTRAAERGRPKADPPSLTDRAALVVATTLAFSPPLISAQADPRVERLKTEALQMVEARAEMVQEIVDMLFSFGELGMQEFETQRYLTGILADHGFDIELGVAGMPSAWTARWSNGSGEPVIALGSDVDGIPQSNQKPGVAYRDPILPMAPGHGEGHNSGQALNIVAALAVKELMERERIRWWRCEVSRAAAPAGWARANLAPITCSTRLPSRHERFRPDSFTAEHPSRIDAEGTPGRDDTGSSRNDQEHRRARDERGGLERARLEKERREDATAHDGDYDSAGNARQCR